MAEKMITVLAGPDVPADKVAFWEVDAKHPDGEAFVAADGREYEVAETPGVRTAVANGRLVRADSRARPAAESDAPAPARRG